MKTFLIFAISTLAVSFGIQKSADAGCPRRVRVLANPEVNEDSNPYERRNGTAIARLLKSLKATRSIKPETIYIVVVDEKGESATGALSAYLKEHNRESRSVYRVARLGVASQVQGERRILYYKLTAAPTVLAKILEDVRVIKWAGWQDPEGPRVTDVETLDITEAGSRIIAERELNYLPDLLSRRNVDRIQQMIALFEDAGSASVETFIVVSDRLPRASTKAASNVARRVSAFGQWERLARRAGVDFAQVDQVRFHDITGVVYRVRGEMSKVVSVLQQRSITWVASELPQFEP